MRKILIAAALLAVAGNAHAVTLVDNTHVALPGTTFAAEPQLGGTVVQDLVQPFSFTIPGQGTITGDVQSRVVHAVDGTYDFYWRIRNLSGTAGFNIQYFRLGNFGIPVAGLNANYRTDGLGSVGPNSAFSFSPTSTPPGPNNQYVNFEFTSTPLSSGQESYFIMLDTNARSYAKTAFYDLADAGTQHETNMFATFGVGAVPEPGAWALMLAGLGLAGGLLRRRPLAARAGA